MRINGSTHGRTLSHANPARLWRLLLATLLVAAFQNSGDQGGLRALECQTNPVVCENQLPGDADYDLSDRGVGDTSIQGFAANISVNVGETVQFKIATDAANYRIDIYRLGFYGGAGARKVYTISDADTLTQLQPPCATDSTTGLVDCGTWAVSASWAVPADAVSGLYLAKLVREDTLGASHIVFVVRDDARRADALFQTSDTTWQAYNKYGGPSLYCDGPIPNPSSYCTGGRAAKVSYNRPFTTRGHDPQSWLFNAEFPMVRWLEANGYDVKYWTGIDTDRRGADLVGPARPKVFLSVGHDEYWSGNQRAKVEAARGAGVHLAFFSGNEIYWKTRWEPSIDGTATPYTTLVTYKETLNDGKIDPSPEWTGTWRDPRFSPPADGGRPENGLIGSIWTVNCCTYAITVPEAFGKLRFWRNTAVANLAPGQVATLAQGTLGYEWGEALDNGFQPAGLMKLSSTTVDVPQKLVDFGKTILPGTATHSLTLYRHNTLDGSGNIVTSALVFGASTVQWSWGLDGDHDRGSSIPDASMQQATVNLLADMGALPLSLQPGADPINYPLQVSSISADTVTPPTSTILFPASGSTVQSGSQLIISGTAADTGGGVVAGVEVSVDGGATWHPAVGRATWTYDWVPGTLGQTTILSRAVDDSGNLSSPGAGVIVAVGPGVCPCTSLWNPSTTVPAVPDAQDGGSVSVGVKFRTDTDGFITAVRYYKSAANVGTHVGSLWTAAGSLLASATFSSETATGWQEVQFGSPVAIAANTTYVASYYAPSGHYAATNNYFTTASIDSPPLHAPSSGVVGGNGVYEYGSGPVFPTQTFLSSNYWVDVVFAPSLADNTPPVISNITSTIIDSSRVTLGWTTNESATSRLDYSTDPAILVDTSILPPGTVTVTLAGFRTSHQIALNGLTPNTTYYYRITSADPSGNAANVAAPSFTVPGPTLRDTVSADFSAGNGSGTYVSETMDGEVILAPAVGNEFSGTQLPAGWSSVVWDVAGTSAVGNGLLLVDGTRVGTCVLTEAGCVEQATHVPARSLEFIATFTGDAYQHSGFGVTLEALPWALFSTKDGGSLYALTNFDDETNLGSALLGSPHRFRIDWYTDRVEYFVDGTSRAVHQIPIAGPMRPIAASDFNAAGGNITINWMRMGPYASSGTFVSRAFDAGAVVNWRSIQWIQSTPAGTDVGISVRAGDMLNPDGSVVGSWVPVAGPDAALNVSSRYIQYQASLTTSDPNTTPELHDIILTTSGRPVAVDDTRNATENKTSTFPASGPGSLVANDSDPDGDPLRVVAVTQPQHGVTFLNANGSVAYTPVQNYNGPDSFAYTVSDGLLRASATVNLLVSEVNSPPVANEDAYFNVIEDTPLVVPTAAGLVANDTDIESDPLTASLVTPPAHGVVNLNPDGSFTYTPLPNYAGRDDFSYRVHDGKDFSGAAAVSLLIANVNDPPIGTGDVYGAVRGETLSVAAPGVLTNDLEVDVPPGPLTAVLLVPPQHGVLTLDQNGSFSYIPNLEYIGRDSFAYRPMDQFNAIGNPAVVTINVALKSVTATSDGGPISTGTTVTAEDPVQSSVTAPANSTVSIVHGVIADSVAPSGFTFLNQQVNIAVTNASGTEVGGTPADPLVLSFMLDASLIPSGVTEATLQIFRNGVVMSDCPGAMAIPSAALDPCVRGRQIAANGDVMLTVLTTHASTWNMGLDSTNPSPVARPDDYSAIENTSILVAAPGVLGNDLGRDALSAALVSPPASGTFTLNATGSFTYMPEVDFFGTVSFTYKATAGTLDSQPETVTLLVRPINHVPTFTKGPDQTVREDAAAQMIPSWATDISPGKESDVIAFQTVTFLVTNHNPGLFDVQPTVTPEGVLIYSGNPDANGMATVTVVAQDNGGTADGGQNTSAPQTFTIRITPVNDAPGFVKGADQTLLEDTSRTVPGWATAIRAGSSNEGGQTLTFLVTNDRNELFSSQPAVTPDGTLTFAPAPNANGSATVTVTLQDNGGTADGGVDVSAPQTFRITISVINDAPGFTKGADQVVNEDSGPRTIQAWATGISAGPSDEQGQSLQFQVTGSSNPGLFAAGPSVDAATGTLTYTPSGNANGSATVTLLLKDNGGTLNGGIDASAPQTFTITVNPVNDAPSFVKGGNQNVFGNAGAQTVSGWASAISAGPANEAGQTVTFMVSNSNTALFSVQPAVQPNGMLTYTPAPSVTGSATVTVRARDDGGTANGGTDMSASQTFTISVNKANTTVTLTTSNTPSLYGLPITFKATVGVIVPGVGIPDGAVLFKNGATVLGSGTLLNGIASFTTSSLAVGTHTITATYAGSALYNGGGSAGLTQEIRASATLNVQFQIYRILDGTKLPKVVAQPVAGALVRVYTRGDACTDAVIVNPRPKMAGVIFDGVDGPGGADSGCPVVTTGSYRAEGITDVNGRVSIIVPPTSTVPNSDYVIVGRTDGFDYVKTSVDPDTLYSMAFVPSITAGASKKVALHQILTFAGKKVPGKLIEEYGSYLGIVQPEFVDWTEDTELYPFVMVTEGEWDITTSVAPPEGFVAQEPELSISLADTTGAIQFTIVDIGSEWTDTVIQHSIRHKGELRRRSDKVRMYDRKPTKARNDRIRIMPDTTANPIDVLANDRVAHWKAPVTVTGVTRPANGTVAVVGNGTGVTYTPAPGFSGTDTFDYTIVDNVGGTATATVTVVVRRPPEARIQNARVVEGNDGTVAAEFRVKLSNASPEEEVTVTYATSDSTAVAGSDYVAASGTITFAPGQDEQTVTVAVIGDTLAERNESFTVRLNGATSATLARTAGATAEGTIVDDDGR